ncbi:MAG: GNAT family N-acetyltransferase [Bacteroidia bacterium]
MIEIVIAGTGDHLSGIKTLFTEYAQIRNYDVALGDFQAELLGLPGKYASPGGCLLLAQIGQQPAGCIAFQPLEPGICEMKRMFVSPAFRGMGIGTALIESLLKEARNAGHKIMRLDTHPWMLQAHKLYLKAGFYEISRYNSNPTPGIRFFEKIID